MLGNPTCKPELVFEAPHEGKRIVLSPANRRYVRLGLREADVLKSLAGQRSLEELKCSPPAGLTAQQIERLITWFDAQQLLVDEPPVPAKRSAIACLLSLLLRPDELRITLLRPDTWLERHASLIHALCSSRALFVYFGLISLPMAVASVWPARVLHLALTFEPQLPALQWAALYVSMLVTIALHELAHALACRHFGARVHRVGLMFLYLNPVAFCDISDSWRLPSRQQKALIAAAGMFLQAILASLAFVMWIILGEGILLHYAAVNITLILVNALPLVKLDGYWVLAHLLDEPNLRAKALGAVEASIRNLLLGRNATPRSVSRWLLAYGVAHLIAGPVFVVLGIVSFYRIGAFFSPGVGVGFAGVLSCALAYRFLVALRVYASTLRKTVRAAHV